ncbi:MAG: phytoene desaturase family protein [Prolixibacteraceae bacterium]
MKYDVIIIGAGLGGLIAGAKLAKEGKKVMLVEQHDRPGGCATNFKRKEFTMEVGLHEMDGLHARDMKTRIFRDLGVLDHVEFIKLPEFYHFVNGRQEVTISHQPEEVQEKLISLFPEEEEGIKAYFFQLINIKKIIKESGDQPEKTLGEFMDSIIQNEDLKLILLGNLGYFHDDPYSLSLTYYSVAQNSYYEGGGNFIQGGSQVLSNYLMDFISNNEGTVLLNHLVKEFIVEDDTAVGIRYQSIKNKQQDLQLAHANSIVANASIPIIASQMLPNNIGEIVLKNMEGLEPAASLLTVYFGFNKKLKDIGHHYYSTFIYDESVKNMASIQPNNHAGFNERSFTFVDYSQIDSRLAPEGKAVGAVCCIDYTSDWENLDQQAYLQKKEAAAQAFISRLEKLIPGFRNAVEYYEVGTAKTVERYTLNPNGAVYGFAQTPKRVKTVVNIPVKNLYFASAWTQTGGGFSGAIFSGYLCAMEVIRSRR